ncbi:GMC family oxidoreductase [Mesorhizobium sp. 2RAF21]|uniref:GMC family oxidoreductase n=1 Tax=Mesorhizobium sp. 2RAF21 TaxID=3232995 RepID=UPI003F953D98
MQSWDYVVVGGGSAGAVAAARLSEDPAVSVLLLEAGGGGKAPFIQIPNGIYFVKGNPRYHWLMPVEPDPTRNGRVELLTCGRGLGGGSSINGMVFVKGLKVDYAEWEKSAGSDWGVGPVNRAFGRVEGAINVDTPSPLHPVADQFIQSAKAFGLPENTTDLTRTGMGVMECPTSASGGWRQSTERGYIRPSRSRKNLTVYTNCVATRLIVESGRVRGVEFLRHGTLTTVYANEEIVLSAGAINSPTLLMRSGIGAADHLRAVGITPVHDLPSVGEGLQDHPCVWISANVRERTWNDDLGLGGIIRAGAQWLLGRKGPAASGMCHATLYGSTEGAAGEPDYQMSFMPAGYVVLDDGVEFLPSSSVTTAVSLCRPVGRGSVKLRSTNLADTPVITYRLLDTEDDMRRLREACLAARAIYASAPMNKTIIGEAVPGPDVKTDAQWTDHIRKHAVNMCHPAASCRMGADDHSVVDPSLRLRGLQGLRIADASIMPQITSGNTNAPSIMIGERVAEFIQRDRAA